MTQQAGKGASSMQTRTQWPTSAKLTIAALLCCMAALGLHAVHPARRLAQYSGVVKLKHRLRGVLLGTVTLPGLLSGTESPAQSVAPQFLAESQIPRVLMTAEYPLNRPIADLPVDTRTLKSGNPYTPKSIADSFHQIFGPNHIRFDTSMPVTVIDSAANPNLMLGVKITTNWGSDNASHVPAMGGRIEGGATASPDSDRHIITYDTATGILHELFGVSINNGVYSAQAYRRWDTRKNQHGKPGQNSADAAGLPILPLLLRYSEASTGPVNHALRFTINLSRANANGGAFCIPASHAAGQNWSSTAYMGMRLRLRPDFDESGYSPINQTILHTMKTYGLVLADNGTSGMVTGDDDPRWDGDDLLKLARALTLNDFLPVNSGPIIDATGQAVQ